MNKDDKKALKALKKLYVYCCVRQCSECIFSKGKGNDSCMTRECIISNKPPFRYDLVIKNIKIHEDRKEGLYDNP